MTRIQAQYISDLLADYDKVSGWLEKDDSDLMGVTLKELSNYFDIFGIVREQLGASKSEIRKTIEKIKVSEL